MDLLKTFIGISVVYLLWSFTFLHVSGYFDTADNIFDSFVDIAFYSFF